MEKKLNLDIEEKSAIFTILMTEISPKRTLFKTLFRGKGLEFDGYRTFEDDEDSNLIDWNSSLRSGSMMARRYKEERDINFMFVIDIGDNMVLGSKDKLKCEIAAELVCAFSTVILNAGDRVGFILYNKEIIRIVPPKGGAKQLDLLVYELSNPEYYQGYNNFSNILRKLPDLIPSSINIVVLISDFIKLNESDRDLLEWIGNTYETIAISIKDPLDMTLPNLDKEVVIEDPETGVKKLINPSIAKKIYEKNSKENFEFVKNIFSDSRIDFINIYTTDDFPLLLSDFLKSRVRSA